jgi:Intracellular proteinase inhibitor
MRALPFRLPRLLTLLGIAAVCMGSTSRSCSLGSSGGDGGDNPSFVSQLDLQDSGGGSTNTFDRGDTIQFVLTVRNRLDTTASAEFTTARTSDFVIVREHTSDVVWKWSDDQPPFAETPTSIDFAAGETRTFSVTWNQILTSGAQLRSGTYEARGVLVYSGFDGNPLRANQMGSTLERFTIR